MVGVVIGRVDLHRSRLRGYVGMLTVDAAYRNRGLGTARSSRPSA
jgi:ribosomal protein S18 acetylase RimI-like enzyme